MTYFKIGDKDFSQYVNQLSVTKSANYNAQTNAAGNTVVDYINSKRTITVGFIPLDDAVMKEVMAAIGAFSVSVSFRNPDTNALESGIACIVPESEIEYYTIQVNKVIYNTFTIEFIEL